MSVFFRVSVFFRCSAVHFNPTRLNRKIPRSNFRKSYADTGISPIIIDHQLRKNGHALLESLGTFPTKTAPAAFVQVLPLRPVNRR